MNLIYRFDLDLWLGICGVSGVSYWLLGALALVVWILGLGCPRHGLGVWVRLCKVSNGVIWD